MAFVVGEVPGSYPYTGPRPRGAYARCLPLSEPLSPSYNGEQSLGPFPAPRKIASNQNNHDDISSNSNSASRLGELGE